MVKLGGYSQSMTGSLKSSIRLVFQCFLSSTVYLCFDQELSTAMAKVFWK